jgi:hypothetical protein
MVPKKGKRMNKGLIAIIIGVLATNCFAGTPRYDQLRAKDSAFPITWKTKNGEIVYDSVCIDKGKGSIAYRNCRREAQKLFREKCKVAKDRRTSPFCMASNRYYP